MATESLATATCAGGLCSRTAGFHVERHLYRWQRRFGTTTPSLGGLSGAGFSANGIVAGGTIGGNYQADAFVFGVEGEFDWDNIEGNPSASIGCQTSSLPLQYVTDF
jgi:hypothetical protein